MMRNLQHWCLEVIAVKLFEGGSDSLVEPLASGGAGQVIKHVPDQRMGELEGLALASQHMLAHALLQQGQQRLPIPTTERPKYFQVNTIAQKSGQGQDLAAACTQLLDAAKNCP